MRLSSALVTLAILLPFASILVTSAACGPGDVCNCPASPTFGTAIALPCDGAPLPSLSLSGVCAGLSDVENGQLYFGASAAGTCHVEATYAGGKTYAADVQFSGEWLACGSNPHGCGELIKAEGLATPADSVYPTLVLGPACADAGGGGDDAGTEAG